MTQYSNYFEDVDHMPKPKRDFILEHKKMIESRASEVKSGELEVSMKGPSALRPVL